MVSPAERGGGYTVLARRFRPQAFAEVVGQENVAQTLRNAIEAGRVGHAFLFTGARGVGKTSMARILAKSLNCPEAVGSEPCNVCDICEGISQGRDMDVVEIDGASNRGIDDIRQLRANVNVKSMRTKYKVYIIDEVHMLTKEAFNALLKTLEEPPPNVKFIFCTTEPNKVPDTILSRCQRFDFGTIQTKAIAHRLAEIAAAEGKQVDPDAVQIIARRAAGSMRDSQSLFDQLLAFGGERITAADVHRLFGTAPDERLIELFDALVARQRPLALQLFNSALTQGVQLSELTDQLLNYLRDLMVLAAGAEEIPLLGVADEHLETLRKQARQWSLRTCLAGLQVLADTKSRMQRSTFGRALAEMALIRLSLLDDLDEVADLIPRLSGGDGPGQAKPETTPVRGPLKIPDRPAAPKAPADPPARPQPRNEAVAAVVAAAPAATPVRSTAPPAPAMPSAPRILPPQVSEEPSDEFAERMEAMAAAEDASPSPGSETAVATAPPRVALEAGRELEFWLQVVTNIPDMLRDYAKKVESAAISGPNQLVVTFPKSYDFGRQCCAKQLPRLERLASEAAGMPVKLTLQTSQTASAVETPAPSGPPAMTASMKSAQRLRQAEQDPLVQRVLSAFEGKLLG